MAAEERAAGRLRVGGWIPGGDPAQTGEPEPAPPGVPAPTGETAWQADRDAGASRPDGTGEGYARRPAPGADTAASGPDHVRAPAARRPGHEAAPTPKRQGPGDPLRSGHGPAAEAGEPWSDQAAPAVAERGRRRLDRPAGRGKRPALLAAAAVLLVTVVGGVLWAVASGEPDPAADGTGTFSAEGTAGATPGAPAATGSPAAAPTPSAAASSAAPSPSPSAAAAFGPVTYEAEAPGNTLLGQAEVVSLAGASGGRAVRHLGDGAGAKKDGALRFNAITVPEAGTYTLTFYYAQAAGPRADRVTIVVAGGATVTVAVGGDGGCCASKAVSVRLKAGANVVTFTNSGGPAPVLDRVVVRRA